MLVSVRDKLPCPWVMLPVLGACLVAVLATMADGPVTGFIAGGVTGIIAGFVIERPLRALAAVTARIAGGDRYAIVPKQPQGPLSELAEAAESLRGAVVEADSLVVDQRRREAEARLHYAGRSFFTRQFRAAVDEVTHAFAAGSDRIGNTAGRPRPAQPAHARQSRQRLRFGAGSLRGRQRHRRLGARHSQLHQAEHGRHRRFALRKRPRRRRSRLGR